jgi:hypothetical protein
MPIRPEAERRLQQGFQKRVDRQYRAYESQHRQATTLGVTFRLGELEGIFAEKLRSASENVGGTLFLLFLLFNIFGVPLVFTETGLYPSGVIIAHSVLALVILLGGLVLSGWLWLRPPQYLWLYAFSDGVAMGSPQSIDQNVIRWRDVTDVRPVWENQFNPVSEESEPRLVAYRLTVYDGRTVAIPGTLRNMLDPYAPVGRVIGALVPASVGQTIPRFPVIGEIIQPHLTQREQSRVPGA